ncbi:unnamed protein product [Candidula unifasciata]|uniref:Uncharacterized protein n=1 Tax=Candidula unifasciata TaxID=100452 RepID=A0A8S3YIJ2_9EUPU|nr:unnamed protein product [Candidula unifasciata]
MEESRMESKCNNDPWAPLHGEGLASSQLLIAQAPENPLNQMIESERYIQTLERRLAQLSKGKQGEPSSKDIITSLALFHDDQMRRYISQTDIIDFGLASCSGSDEMPQTSFVQRKLRPEKQPLNPEELAELVKEDVLAKVFEESVSSTAIETVSNALDAQTYSSHVSEPSANPADLNCTPTADGTHKLIDQQFDIKAATESADENWANFDEFV